MQVVSAFLDEHGIAHPSESVAKRACYLFCRLAKFLRSQLRPLLPDILQVGWRRCFWLLLLLLLACLAFSAAAAAAARHTPGVLAALL